MYNNETQAHAIVRLYGVYLATQLEDGNQLSPEMLDRVLEGMSATEAIDWLEDGIARNLELIEQLESAWDIV